MYITKIKQFKKNDNFEIFVKLLISIPIKPK